MMASHLGFMSQIPSLLMDIIIGSVTSLGCSNNGKFKEYRESTIWSESAQDIESKNSYTKK